MHIQLTEEFENALNLMRSGKNVLITGKAGTGKSTLLRLFLDQSDSSRLLVAAPTGVAALNVQGFTIHKAFGFVPGQYPDDIETGGTWKPRAEVIEVLRNIDVLVIDEISMVRADLFDMMDVALRRVRRDDRVFGGLQLILVGDLLQLPPVVTNHEAVIHIPNSVHSGSNFGAHDTTSYRSLGSGNSSRSRTCVVATTSANHGHG